MTAQKVRLTDEQKTVQAVKTMSDYNAQATQLANIAWHVAYTALWNTQDFSFIEKENAINQITIILQTENNLVKAYSNFVQRVLLARQYINTHAGTYAPLPTKWLCTSNKNGFAGTQKWLEKIESTRISLPKYKQSLKAFAEAIQETTTSKFESDFHYWRSYFAEQNLQSSLNLFLSTIANISNNLDR